MTDVRRHLDQTLVILSRRLDALLDKLDEQDDAPDVDLQSADGKIVLEFEDRIKFIINRQSGNDQIWVAEPQRGWHFEWVDNQWICDNRGIELFASLEQLIGDKIGQPVVLQTDC